LFIIESHIISVDCPCLLNNKLLILPPPGLGVIIDDGKCNVYVLEFPIELHIIFLICPSYKPFGIVPDVVIDKPLMYKKVI
jgi:hypothetical protein